jgi:hypothetical protein
MNNAVFEALKIVHNYKSRSEVELYIVSYTCTILKSCRVVCPDPKVWFQWYSLCGHQEKKI